jgi:hypothetical protein
MARYGRAPPGNPRGPRKPRLDPNRIRIPCEAPRCWREAHAERYLEDDGPDDLPMHLCPTHADVWRSDVSDLDVPPVVPPAFTRETAQDGQGDEPEVDARSCSVPPEYSPAAFAAVIEENRERRYQDRVPLGFPTTNVRQTNVETGPDHGVPAHRVATPPGPSERPRSRPVGRGLPASAARHTR